MFPFTHKSVPLPRSFGQADGFILLEVLVAMSLVASSWMALGITYQQLVLRLGQLQGQRVQIKQALDQHELAYIAAAGPKNINLSPRKSVNESIGMSRRSRPLTSSSRAPH